MTTTSNFGAWITCPISNPQAQLRLFCFPYAGGGTSLFRTWPHDLPSKIEVCSCQLPGRENRLAEASFTQLPPLIQALARILHPYLDVPFAFFGHSMGALIGFELARYLRRQYGLSPLYLFVSASRAPQIPAPDLPIHQLPDAAFVEELRDLHGTPEAILQSAELMQLLLPTLRADFALCETYTYASQEPLSCPISAFGGLQDSKVSRGELLAWAHQTSSLFTLRLLPGDHFFLHNAQAFLLRAISQDLIWLLARKSEEQGVS